MKVCKPKQSCVQGDFLGPWCIRRKYIEYDKPLSTSQNMKLGEAMYHDMCSSPSVNTRISFSSFLIYQKIGKMLNALKLIFSILIIPIN